MSIFQHRDLHDITERLSLKWKVTRDHIHAILGNKLGIEIYTKGKELWKHTRAQLQIRKIKPVIRKGKPILEDNSPWRHDYFIHV